MMKPFVLLPLVLLISQVAADPLAPIPTEKVGLSLAEQIVLNKKQQIIIPDQYQLFTAPTGYFDASYGRGGSKDVYDIRLQTLSDLLYHSADITYSTNETATTSRVSFTRYKDQEQKYLGIWQQYRFGDVWLSSATGDKIEKGLGAHFSSDLAPAKWQNLVTSFAKTAEPGWQADIFRNGVYLYSQTVPDNGLLEVNNVQLLYGQNQFRIELYGPFGQRTSLEEVVEVGKSRLSSGDIAYGLSFIEEDQSLLDFNLSDLEFDTAIAHANFAVNDVWQVGFASTFRELSDSQLQNTQYQLSNQFALPNWYIGNTISFDEQQLSQSTQFATSFFNDDSFTVQLSSYWDKSTEQSDHLGDELVLDYYLQSDRFVNQFSVRHNTLKRELSRFEHRVSFFSDLGFNISNALSYDKVASQRALQQGSLSIATRFSSNIRLLASLPYQFSDGFKVQRNAANLSVDYYIRQQTGSHSLQLKALSLFDNPAWQTSYRYAFDAKTHQLTFAASYAPDDKWRVSAGVQVHFGYNYFNEQMTFSNQYIQTGAILDVHAFLDRRLNGIPDILDKNLTNVGFIGDPLWQGVKTNHTGRAELLSTQLEPTVLQGAWQKGSKPLIDEYVIYTHPGSVHKINMPFYLTSQLELFVLLESDGNNLSLSEVPVVIKNRSTGNVYHSVSDADGLVNPADLQPGSYSVYVDSDYLKDKGLVAEYREINFDGPLQGGYVILPNIILKSASLATEGPSLEVVLNEDKNYMPIIADATGTVIHLPPKGNTIAPYQSDQLTQHQFNPVTVAHSKTELEKLRHGLDIAQAMNERNNYGVKQALISLGDEAVADNVFTNVQNQQQKELSIFSPKVTLEQGWVVQFASALNIEAAQIARSKLATASVTSIVKKKVDNVTWYCVVSQPLANRSDAQELLLQSGLDGFVNQASVYQGFSIEERE